MKVLPWARSGDTDAFAEDLPVVIVVQEDRTWFGPYPNRGIATRSAQRIAAVGDNQRRRTPMDGMVLVRARDWPHAHGMSEMREHRLAAARSLRAVSAYLSRTNGRPS